MLSNAHSRITSISIHHATSTGIASGTRCSQRPYSFFVPFCGYPIPQSESRILMSRSIVISGSVVIDSGELDFSFVRSRGPGGQNVNKRNTKAVLRWDVSGTECLPDAVKHRFLSRYAHRISQQGELVLASDRYREQERNIAECERKLREMVRAVLVPPRARKKTRRTRASVERRLQEKRSAATASANAAFAPTTNECSGAFPDSHLACSHGRQTVETAS